MQTLLPLILLCLFVSSSVCQSPLPESPAREEIKESIRQVQLKEEVLELQISRLSLGHMDASAALAAGKGKSIKNSPNNYAAKARMDAIAAQQQGLRRQMAGLAIERKALALRLKQTP